ncbi:MAG: hypothetical protein PF440_01865 [Thiomicrorhabdus sp.]|nr:hypothetical protein [Thiomicrorhabdus sp.]
MANVESIKKNKTSSYDWTVIETLRELANEIERGEINHKKCMVLLLEDGDGKYNTGFRLAQMRGSEAVALMEIMKADLVNGINGLPSDFHD